MVEPGVVARAADGDVVEVAGVAVIEPEDAAAFEAAVVEDAAATEIVEAVVLEDTAALEVVEAASVVAFVLVQTPSVWQPHYSSLLGPPQTSSVVRQQLLLLTSPHQ